MPSQDSSQTIDLIKNSSTTHNDETIISPVLPTYARADIAFERGDGAFLYSEDGGKYLDFGTGIGVCNLGHNHPALVSALTKQAGKLWHTSNLYRINGQEELAQKLSNNSFADSMFFTNSGAEAMECAIKMTRKYHYEQGNPDRQRIITFEGCFHGRTLGTIAAAGSEKLTKGFGYMLEGFDNVPFYKDMSKVEEQITEKTAAILIEPIQGEGGIRPVSKENLKILRDLADKHGILLIFDEVQCGMGRTGHLFAHQSTKVTPDILASAKGIGGGFPLGVCMANEKVARVMTAGTHGSTYGGNPLAMAVGNAVVDVMLEDGFMDHVAKMSETLKLKLLRLRKEHPTIIDVVRGSGLMLGLKLHVEPVLFFNTAREFNLLLVPASHQTVRLLPPLIITEKHIDTAMIALAKTCSYIEKHMPKTPEEE